MTRTLLKAISRLLIGVVLFGQFAVASYACPGMTSMSFIAHHASETAAPGAAAANAHAAEPAGMPPGCDQMDPGTANLCAAHCQQGQQSADTASLPVLGAAIPTFLYSIPLEPLRSLGSGRFFPAADAGLDAAPEPPHAILHCVFRL